MTPIDRQAAAGILLQLQELIEAAGERWFLIGGMAVSALGVERLTVDIDATVTIENESLERFVELASRMGFAPRLADAVQFARQSRMILLVHERSGVGIDLAMAGTTFEREALERALRVPFDDAQVPVASVEDLIVSKLVASRPKDLEDVRNLLDINGGLDLVRIRGWLREFDDALDNPGLPALFEQLRAEVASPEA